MSPDYSNDPREREAVRRAHSPEFMSEMGEATRGGPDALASLYREQSRQLRFWTVLSLLAFASIAAVVVVAWMSTWWLLLGIWGSLALAQQATIRATAYRKRMEAMEMYADVSGAARE